MDMSAWILLGTAASVALVHTLVGVDHTLPFIVLGKAQRWSALKFTRVVTLCGLGHVLSSVLIGTIGLGVGAALGSLELLEGKRAHVAAYALIAFGLIYAVWGFWRERRATMVKAPTAAFWGLFIVIALGPCEPLIPLLMVPALSHGVWLAVLASAVFGFVTIATMLVVAWAGYYGASRINVDFLNRYAHTFAGVAMAISGVMMQFVWHPH